jgi:hypothetical protein
MCAWVDGFGRGWRGFGLVFDYIGALDNRKKWERAARVQSKSERLRQKMITFDDIEIYFSGSGEGSREWWQQEGTEGRANGRRLRRELHVLLLSFKWKWTSRDGSL